MALLIFTIFSCGFLESSAISLFVLAISSSRALIFSCALFIFSCALTIFCPAVLLSFAKFSNAVSLFWTFTARSFTLLDAVSTSEDSLSNFDFAAICCCFRVSTSCRDFSNSAFFIPRSDFNFWIWASNFLTLPKSGLSAPLKPLPLLRATSSAFSNDEIFASIWAKSAFWASLNFAWASLSCLSIAAFSWRAFASALTFASIVLWAWRWVSFKSASSFLVALTSFEACSEYPSVFCCLVAFICSSSFGIWRSCCSTYCFARNFWTSELLVLYNFIFFDFDKEPSCWTLSIKFWCSSNVFASFIAFL